ncbi:MAG: site-specific integrase [Oscillospiraceae bacterium]|nr:site-specific integrase [Oscillospiraceae bacterium]
MLNTCLQAAAREKLLRYNPVDDCKPPKLVRKEMKTLEPEQVQAYLKAADARSLLPMFFLELTTGMRKSELVALKWTDVDWKERTISVNKQAYVTDGKLTVVPPKTANSVRKIALSEETLTMLKQQKKANKESHPSSPYIFPSPVAGEMYHPDSVVNLHKKILKEAGLEHIRFHDLRHRLAGDGPLLSLRDISPASPGESPSQRWPYKTAWT